MVVIRNDVGLFLRVIRVTLKRHFSDFGVLSGDGVHSGKEPQRHINIVFFLDRLAIF